jgi:hypothetical protein
MMEEAGRNRPPFFHREAEKGAALEESTELK